MGTKVARQKNAAAVALGREGGKKGGPARAASLSSKQRSESARKAVQARWAKAKELKTSTVLKKPSADTSDQVVLDLLGRLKATSDPSEIRRLSDQLERAIFHKQYKSTRK